MGRLEDINRLWASATGGAGDGGRRRTGGVLTAHDAVLAACLEETARHLAVLGRLGRWTANCDRLDTRLGRYGMGRN